MVNSDDKVVSIFGGVIETNPYSFDKTFEVAKDSYYGYIDLIKSGGLVIEGLDGIISDSFLEDLMEPSDELKPEIMRKRCLTMSRGALSLEQDESLVNFSNDLYQRMNNYLDILSFEDYNLEDIVGWTNFGSDFVIDNFDLKQVCFYLPNYQESLKSYFVNLVNSFGPNPIKRMFYLRNNASDGCFDNKSLMYTNDSAYESNFDTNILNDFQAFIGTIERDFDIIHNMSKYFKFTTHSLWLEKPRRTTQPLEGFERDKILKVA